MLLVERGEGVETKPIKTSYSSAACTAYVTFDNVKVPLENTLGPEDGGLSVILSNFNHERWVMCCTSVSAQRFVVEECMKSAWHVPLDFLLIFRILGGRINAKSSGSLWCPNQ